MLQGLLIKKIIDIVMKQLLKKFDFDKKEVTAIQDVMQTASNNVE